jgi:hypothetical protein
MLTWAGATPETFEREDPASFTARDRKSKLSVRQDSIGPPPRRNGRGNPVDGNKSLSLSAVNEHWTLRCAGARAEASGPAQSIDAHIIP